MKKLFTIISIISIFLLSFIIHNLYEWFPNMLTTIFCPVNESIFEHMKMIFSSYIIWIILKHIILKLKNITQNCYVFKELIFCIFNILLFLLIYLPIHNKFGENLIVTLIIYFISITISQLLNSNLNFNKNSKILNILSIILIFLIYTMTTHLTYNPIIDNFFLDPTNNSYGLNK